MQYLLDRWEMRRPQPNLTAIAVRPLQPDDVELIAAMHERLSPESIYSRYLQQRPPGSAEMAALGRLDPASGAGFVATAQQRTEIVVGLAHYVREAQTELPIAEAGILVEDQFQGQRVGRILWQRLQQHAQAHQIHQLRVLLHPHNLRMQRLVQGGGLPYTARAQDGLYEYLVTLEPGLYSLPSDAIPAPPAFASTGRSLRSRFIWC